MDHDIDSPDPWRRLGLPEGGDAQAVRKAYRRLLRRHRPESDPEGFRRLREAYEELKDGESGGSGETWFASACEPPAAELWSEITEKMREFDQSPVEDPVGDSDSRDVLGGRAGDEFEQLLARAQALIEAGDRPGLRCLFRLEQRELLERAPETWLSLVVDLCNQVVPEDPAEMGEELLCLAEHATQGSEWLHDTAERWRLYQPLALEAAVALQDGTLDPVFLGVIRDHPLSSSDTLLSTLLEFRAEDRHLAWRWNRLAEQLEQRFPKLYRQAQLSLASAEAELQARREDRGLGSRGHDQLWQGLWQLDQRIGSTPVLPQLFPWAYYRWFVRRRLFVHLQACQYSLVELLVYLEGEWGAELPALSPYRCYLHNDWEAWMMSLGYALGD